MKTDSQSEATSQNLSRVLDIARATLDSELERANRWDEKARGQATLAGAWFAVTQTVAAIALGSSAPKGWVIVLSIGLALQAGALVMDLVRAAQVWAPQDRDEFGRETLEALEGRIDEPVAQIAAALIGFYTTVLDEAQLANENRGKAFDKASFWWWPVLGIGLVEIAVALLSRVA
ncbi:MAG TPA: hypothetical protein VIJ39_02265 [Solirubrobacteraceae bacterium]